MTRKHQRCTSRVASQIHLVKLDSCFQDLSMLCANYQSSGIAGSQEEDFLNIKIINHFRPPLGPFFVPQT